MSKQAADQTVQAMQEAIASSDGTYEPEPKRRRWLFWGVITLIVIMLVILVAPWIATRTAVRNYLVAQAVPPETASVSIQSVSVGWFSPMEITGLQVLDGDSQPLVEVGKVRLDRTLLQLAQDYTNLGQITVDSPTVHLQLRPDGSNLEDTIAKLSSSAEPSESQSTAVSANIKVLNARVLATEQATGRQWNIEQFNAEADLPSSASENWVVIANGTLNGQPFAVETATPIGLATDVWPLGPVGNAKVTAQQLPLEPLRYAALRSGQPIQHLTGFLSLNVLAKWSPIPGSDTQSLPQLDAEAVVRTDNLQFAEPSLLGQDALQVTALQLNTTAQLAGDTVNLNAFDLQSDFGHASLQTSARVSDLNDTTAIVNSIRQQQLKTNGRLDIAALARSLPNTFKIRDDVQVANGQFVWDIHSVPNHNDRGTTRWVGQASTEEVQVLRDGQPINWKFPLKIDFAVLDGQEPEVENVLVKSDFFELSGQGKLRQGAFQATADLEKLVLELDQVVDLGGVYVNGGMQSLVQWNEAQPNQLQLKAQAKLTDFVMAQNEQLLCQEKELVTVLDTVATLNGQAVSSLESAQLDVASGGDFFIAQLQSAVANPGANSTWPVVCRVKGGLNTWFARLKTMGLGHGWDVGGDIDATTVVSANQRGIAIQNLVVDARNLEAAAEGILVAEPVVQLQTAGTVDLTTYACRFPTTTVGSQSLALLANNISVDMEPNFVVAGDIGYRADLGRLMSYTVTDPSAATTKVTGEASGRLHLEAKEQTTSFRITGEVANLQVDQLQVDPNMGDVPGTMQTVWQEDKLVMETTGSYDAVQDQLDLREARVDGKVLNLAAQGSAAQLATNPTVNVTGEYGYQLEGLLAIFRDMVGSDVQLTGNQRQRFAIQGPLFPAVATAKDRVSQQLVAQGGLGWDTANIYETPLGAAQVDALLQDGVMRMSPLQLAVGEGQVNVAPTLHVNTEPLWMTIEPATVVDHIRITPEMTKTWMKYLAPLLADATNAEGTFSVNLDRAEVPLMDPTSGNIAGQFIVHGGALGPGPLATQFIEMATNIKRLTGQGQGQITNATGTWVELGEQQVTFQVAENRVYHEGFQMIIDGVPVRTRGSVGILDESINVMAEVPIMDEWIAGNEALAGLRGQTIQIPVTGTTSRPQLDKQALANVSRQMAGVAARGFLQKEVGKQLQKTLGVGNVQDAIGGAQDKLNTKLQGELGKQLNRFFK